MNKSNELNKFYDFINMYNSIIKHCANKERKYTIDLFYLNNTLNFRILDQQSRQYIFNDGIECNEFEAEILTNNIASEFILNHKITLSSFTNISLEDIQDYYSKSSAKHFPITYKHDGCYNVDGQKMLIHELVNSIFTLKIYHYNGINNMVEEIHNKALEKITSETHPKVLSKNQ